jgi:hypothetical protein
MTKDWQLIFALLLFSLLSINTIAQQSVFVMGNVDNLQNVNIKIQESSFGTVTNEKGEYGLQIFLSDQTTSIQYSRIGYQDTIIYVHPKRIKSDTIVINISLKEIDYSLEEVIITSQSEFFKLTNTTISDLEFLNTDIILLTTKNHKSELLIINEGGEILLRHVLKEIYHEIHKDCFGQFELIGKDSCLQFHYEQADTLLHVIDKFSTIEFYEKLEHCLLEINNCYVFSSKIFQENSFFADKFHRKKVDYFFININDSIVKRTLLHSFFDKDAFQNAQSIFNEIVSTYYRTTPDIENIIVAGAWDGNLLKLINDNNELFNLISWYQKIESKPIKIEAFKVKDNILLINQTDEKILKYDQNLVSLFEVSFSSKINNSHQLKSIIQDKKTEAIYGVFIENGIYIVVGINPYSGEFSEQKKACPAPFPDIFNLNNKYAYSVYYDPTKRLTKIVQTSIFPK